ncbi:MAG: type II toxin-antitoxin system ParD family antitoxin [Blastomonas sp.]|uniref:type II toxin-antitoxin system ParD family antitoxin n=1 Tax=unclassified Blastomonas TaxID=2626550 RepID=UPI0009EB5F39|nr:type II toxin-antitoxin system ParD family antitoxin [Blastomonas sp.]
MDDERSIIEGIEQGLADVRAGRVISHESVVRESEAMIHALRNALIEGERSGEPRGLDFDALKTRKRVQRTRRRAFAGPSESN